MRIAVLCDIHGNLPALEAVLSEVESVGVDLVVFGGDVAAGPMPVETIEVLAGYTSPSRFVRGNADSTAGRGRVRRRTYGWRPC